MECSIILLVYPVVQKSTIISVEEDFDMLMLVQSIDQIVDIYVE